MKYRWLLFLLLFSSLALCTEGGEAVQIHPRSIYSGRCSDITVLARSLANRKISWALKVKTAIAARGSCRLDGNGQGAINISLPQTSKDYIIDAQLLIDGSGIKTSTDIGIFSEDAFCNKALVNACKISILVLDASSDPAGLFKANQIQFKHLESIDEFTGGTLIVSGVDFDEYTQLPQKLCKMAEKSSRIIVLAPLKGCFTLPKTSSRIVMANSEIIKTFDRHFDSGFFLRPGSRGFMLSSRDEQPVIEFGSTNAYGFCEISYTEGSVIICSWDLIGSAARNPTPLYLLKQLIIGKKNSYKKER